ncbi:MAG: ABC transporter substrate-binding protein [Phycisphaerales bacterium]
MLASTIKRTGVFAWALAMGLAALSGVGCDSKPAAKNGGGSGGGTPNSGGSAGDANLILVGHYASLTGSEATFGQSTDRGIRLAIEDLNAAGGLNGKQFKLITYDDKGDSNEAGKAVTRLISKDKVSAVLGEVASGLSLAGGAVCQEQGVPMISPSSTNPRVTEGRDMVFRVCFTDDQQAAAIAKFVRENLKLTKAAILFEQTSPYSKGLRDDFTKAFVAGGGTIVSDQPYSKGDQEYSAQLTSIREAKPEILFVPGYYTEGGNIALQARKLGLTIPLIGGDGWDSEQFAEIGKDAVEGCYYSNHSAPDQPDSNIGPFIEKYKAKYEGQTPDALGGLGYDAMMVLADAMKRASSLEGKDLAKAIADTKGYKGVSGTITIDAKRNARKPIVIVRMTGGKPTWVATIDPTN